MLCVPIKPLKARKKAIILMRKVYSKAFATIVLDEALENSHSHRTAIERLAVFHTVDWTSRLWTVQEFALSSTTLVVYGGELVDLENTIRSALQPRDDDKGGDKEEYLYKHLYVLRSILSGAFQNYRHLDSDTRVHDFMLRSSIRWSLFHFIQQNLAFRTTSHAEDEAVCLAVLFNLGGSLPFILDAPDDTTRYERSVRALPYAPRAFPFLPFPRLAQEGLRWAPKAFLNTNFAKLHWGYNSAGVNDTLMSPVSREGLLLQAAGFYLTLSDVLAFRGMKVILFCAPEKRCKDCLKVLCHHVSIEEKFFHMVAEAERNTSPSTGEYAIISRRYPTSTSHVCDPSKDKVMMPWTMSALVKIKRTPPGIIYARYVGLPVVEMTEEQTPNIKYKVRPLKRIPEHQLWCVG
jgi:hypothetical protein